jgi:dTDP-4-dehydrorhamnose reductase
MNVILFGADGQLGRELLRTCPQDISLTSFEWRQLDITDSENVDQAIHRCNPDWIVNAAAYTAVDQAESDHHNAYKVNCDGPATLASAAVEVGARMIQISTDFVFSGRQGTGYQPTDKPEPVCVYGASKRAGEEKCLGLLGDKALIMRTAWLYSRYGNNFVLTMLRLLREKKSLRIVADQVGTPTWAHGLARAVWAAVEINLWGIHHWTDAGVAGWYDFAVAIQEESLELGLIEKEIPIHPIPTSEYPTPAARPCFSVLDKSATWSALNMQPIHWRQALRQMLRELKTPEK